ncbi:MAG TPA: hypothetical protein VH682_31065 [Gemmataceae bacterium]|jgi:hypothetical protein
MRRLHFPAALALFLGLLGCGDGLKRVPVQGKITAKGQPLENATVQFIPAGSTQGEGGMGVSDNDGNFTLIGSRAGAKGVVAGEYKVRVSRLLARDGTPLPADAKQADNPGCKESVPVPYASLEATPLKATVPEAGGEVAIDIPAKILGRK